MCSDVVNADTPLLEKWPGLFQANSLNRNSLNQPHHNFGSIKRYSPHVEFHILPYFGVVAWMEMKISVASRTRRRY